MWECVCWSVREATQKSVREVYARGSLSHCCWWAFYAAAAAGGGSVAAAAVAAAGGVTAVGVSVAAVAAAVVAADVVSYMLLYALAHNHCQQFARRAPHLLVLNGYACCQLQQALDLQHGCGGLYVNADRGTAGQA